MLNGMVSLYLNQLVPVSSLLGRRLLRSSFTLQLHIPQYRLSTAGRRSFHVAAFIFLEHCARWRAVCTVCLFLPARAKDILVSPVISGHFSLNFLYYVLVDWTLQQFRLFLPREKFSIDTDIWQWHSPRSIALKHKMMWTTLNYL